ncbi:Aste57867_15389 [Aphanomyces stellatus]|uniref:Aste57867_15389 protein n=1 Tax=Aphanomyces stellatus TaxID=120398 RepID=A0A485L315_9STRA|nr:hypothetical protein As57867_015333 [Aphanomyces stellatus]VFT92195.1 Aste57867_15389 [Aphanomyces stellatus]
MKTAAAFAAVAALAMADDSVMQCTGTASALIQKSQGGDAAAACQKESGVSLALSDVTDATLKRIADAAACQTWWKANVAAINEISPACDMVNPFAGVPGTVVKTDKFATSLSDFLASVKKLAADQANKPTNVTKPDNDAGATIAKPATTTATPAAPAAKPSSSVTTFVSATAVVVAAFLA